MVIEVRKKRGETTRNLLRRFSRRVQQSRILIHARKLKFYDKGKSKRDRKEGALRRIKIGKEKEKLRKLGLLEEEPRWKKRR